MSNQEKVEISQQINKQVTQSYNFLYESGQEASESERRCHPVLAALINFVKIEIMHRDNLLSHEDRELIKTKTINKVESFIVTNTYIGI